jgi:EAL domain-containing protein (putative c-di-GMP-specific phosphodiesterase class I)
MESSKIQTILRATEEGRMDQFWAAAIDRLTFAFQPILWSKDGRIFAVEALLRGCREAGFSSIHDVFDLAHNDRRLVEVEVALREKSLRLFSLLPLDSDVKLFSNLDNRVLTCREWRPSLVHSLLTRVGLDPDRLVIEVSERHPLCYEGEGLAGLSLALDDFGTGYAGLETLWKLKPRYLKIDRLFVSGSGTDPKKRALLGQMVALARSCGAFSILEGAETPDEIEACLGVGGDAIQGFGVGRPRFNGEPFEAVFDRQGLLFPPAAAKLRG